MSTIARFRSMVVAATSGLAVVLAVALPIPQSAQAADLRAFDAGYIISDALFYDSGTMNAAAIQSFLVQKGSSCVAAPGSTCLKNFRQTTATRATDSRCTRTYTGATNETAAQIIAKVASSCGINPQVLLVMLQKEQGLVTARAGASAGSYRSAMGFGCPDTAVCSALYYGFFNQVYSAAHQYKNYALSPLAYGHRAGMVNQVRFSPATSCGTSGVFIQNQATASLYNYTPYQPNAAALAAGYGTGDSCSAYGNRNFWNYFTDWFGPTTQRQPVGWLDSASTSPGVISVSGWALDPDTTASINVHAYVDGVATKAMAAANSRPDVGRTYRRGDNHGFSGTVNAGDGLHQVCIYAIDSAGGSNPRIGCATVKVTNLLPIGALDAVSSSEGRIAARGWALDPDTTGPIAVHLYVDGKATQAFTANTSRPDVGRIYGKGDNHGFSGTVNASAGIHQVCMYAIDASGGANPRVACKSVNVTNLAPIGALDAVSSSEGRIAARGWALDPDTTGPISVYMYVDGKATQAFTANTSRPDVGRIYGKGDNHGFSGTVNASAGIHQVCMYAIDASGGANPRVACKSVNVINQAPTGALDKLTSGMESFTLGGWALDADTTGPITVNVFVDGKMAQTLTANASRPSTGDNHGFQTTLPAVYGPHAVCIYAIDSWVGLRDKVGCSTVDVNGLAFGALDSATATSGKITVKGWALDPNTTDPIAVHVYISGEAAQALTANASRPDVGRIYGKGDNHGFSGTLNAPTGTQSVCVYAIDSWRRTNPLIKCQSVKVP